MNDPQNIESSRVNVSIGLVTLYVAAFAYLFPDSHTTNPIYPYLDGLKGFLLLTWGVPSVMLLIFLFTYALSLKYTKPNSLFIFGYYIRVTEKIKKTFFDTGVEYYISGLFINSIYTAFVYLIGKGIPIYLLLIIYFILFGIFSFFLLLIEKNQANGKDS